MSTSRATPLYPLSRAPTPVRWAVTLFLGTIGVGYVFGILMVTLWVGLTPRDVAEVFRERQMEIGVEGAAAPVTERLIDLEEVLGEEEQHRIDTRLLVQDTHVHIPVYALIALALALIALGLRWRARSDLIVIFALFTGPALDFAGMWLTKFVADGFSYMTLAGGWLMAASYATVAAAALWQMWIRNERRSET